MIRWRPGFLLIALMPSLALATLSVDADADRPSRIYLDDVEVGTTPLKITGIEPGEHELRFQEAGGERRTVFVVVSPQHAHVEKRLFAEYAAQGRPVAVGPRVVSRPLTTDCPRCESRTCESSCASACSPVAAACPQVVHLQQTAACASPAVQVPAQPVEYYQPTVEYYAQPVPDYEPAVEYYEQPAPYYQAPPEYTAYPPRRGNPGVRVRNTILGLVGAGALYKHLERRHERRAAPAYLPVPHSPAPAPPPVGGPPGGGGGGGGCYQDGQGNKYGHCPKDSGHRGNPRVSNPGNSFGHGAKGPGSRRR